MKSSRAEKLLVQLRFIEGQLTERLTAILPGVVSGRRTLIFTNREFNPHSLGHLDHEADLLLDLARQGEELRARLVLAANEGPAHLYLQACEEAADLSNPNRFGPRRLGERVLAALERQCVEQEPLG